MGQDMTTKNPITVAEFIKRLATIDPSAVVMIDCADTYYSGPVSEDGMSAGEAGLRGPQGSYQGGWVIIEGDWPGEVLERRPCLTIRADG